MLARALLAALALWSASVLAQDVSCRVVGVSDGDTLTCLTAAREELKVRLADIDAPESGQEFGAAAKQSLSELVFGKPVQLSVTDRDRYGRLVARVMVGGIDVNMEQMNRGMAWAYRKYTRDQEVIMAESRARVKATGLWSSDDQTPPWEWRSGGKSSAATIVREESRQPAKPETRPARSLDGFFANRDYDRIKKDGGYSSARGASGYAGSQEIYVGPRGGRYVITESGNKRYVGKGK